ncbi:MAG: protein kinase, partial [Proteobacteria bacterium]|nr:protein kinase [Pseudomonadota bacterium]
MATVYLAYDEILQVERAIKILAPKMATNRSVRRRFFNEARMMAKVQHNHIVALHDVGIDEDRLFIVMELLRGGNLKQRVKRAGPLPPRMAC